MGISRSGAHIRYLDNVFYLLLREDVPRRVSRVDDSDPANLHTISASARKGCAKIGHLRGGGEGKRAVTRRVQVSDRAGCTENAWAAHKKELQEGERTTRMMTAMFSFLPQHPSCRPRSSGTAPVCPREVSARRSRGGTAG